MTTGLTSVSTTAITVAISYSWDTKEHEQWVLDLAHLLQVDGGVHVLLDKYELQPGRSMTHFMEQAVDKADKVLLIMTPTYKEKADNRRGGAGFESSMISQQLYEHQSTNKFIPIVRHGNYQTASPIFLKPYVSLDMTSDADFKEKFKALVQTIYDQPVIPRPTLGPVPDFISANPTVTTYNPAELIDERKDMAINGMPNFYKWIIAVRLRSLQGQSNSSLFNLLTTNMVREVDYQFPLVYILQNQFKISHFPSILFDIPDRNSNIINVFDHECLKIDNGIVYYEFAYYSNQQFMVPVLNHPFGTLLYLLLILRKAHEKAKKSPDLTVELHFRANQRSILSSGSPIPLDPAFSLQSMYIPGNEAQRSIPISELSNDTLFEVFQELYSIYSAENPRSALPFIQLDRSEFEAVVKKIV